MVGLPIHEILELAFFIIIESLAGEMTVEYQEGVLTHVQAINHAGILAATLELVEAVMDERQDNWKHSKEDV